MRQIGSFPQVFGAHIFKKYGRKQPPECPMKLENSLVNALYRQYTHLSVDYKAFMSNWATKKTLLLSIESWLVNRDPYHRLSKSLYDWVRFHPLYNPTNQGPFFLGSIYILLGTTQAPWGVPFLPWFRRPGIGRPSRRRLKRMDFGVVAVGNSQRLREKISSGVLAKARDHDFFCFFSGVVCNNDYSGPKTRFKWSWNPYKQVINGITTVITPI